MGLIEHARALIGEIGPGTAALVAFVWATTLLGAWYTFATHDYHGEPRTLRGFARFCSPWRIVMARQTRLDFVYATVLKLSRPLWGWVPFRNLAVAYLLYDLLNRLPREEWDLAGYVPHSPTVLEQAIFVVAGIVITDFLTFYGHYLEHRLKPMWEFHKVHHSALSLNPVTAHRFHPVQELWDGLWTSLGAGAWIALYAYVLRLPLTDVSILGIGAYSLANCFSFYHLRHSHIHMRYPLWLERIVMSPAQHQIHHSCELRHRGRNFGLLLSCWDQWFGTIAYSEPQPVTRLGLDAEQERYTTVPDLFAMPFVQLARKLWLRAERLRPPRLPPSTA